MTPHRCAGNAGFTLVEMLVAVAIAGLVGMAALTVFTSASRTTTAQTELTQAQQSVRASMDRMAQHTRSAGFGLPERQSFSLIFVNGAVTNTFTRPVTVTNSSTAPDTLDLVGIGREAGVLNDYQADGCNVSGSSCLSLPNVNGEDGNKDFKRDDGTFIPLRRYISLGGAAYLQVSGVEGSNKIILTAPLEGFPEDYFKVTPHPSVFILQALRYSIATDLLGCSVLQPCLAVQDFTELGGSGRQVLAQGIEDLQVGAFISPNSAAGGSATFSNNGSTSSARLSALRINLVGKANTPDRSAIFQRPALEDRAAGANDSFRRRVLTTVVKIRNPRPGS